MRDATIVTLETQLDALAARIATLERRHEQLIHGLTGAGERLSECAESESHSNIATLAGISAKMRQATKRATRVRDLEEGQRREQLEREHEETLRELTRRVGRLEGGKR